MKIVQINTCSYGSTGNIAIQLCRKVEGEGGQAWLCVPDGRHNRKKYGGDHIWIGGRVSEDLHLILSRLTGLNGYFSALATRRFLKEVEQIDPDVIHLHNLHNSYINLPMLFRFLKKSRARVVWTLHDCWSFTGQCPHFVLAGCDKWKTGCHSCPQYREYPQSFVDRTRLMYRKKKEWFTDVPGLTIVTPSQWLGDLVKQSFLKEYPVRAVNNGIDLSVFQPRGSDFRQRHHIGDKKIILGVSFGWGYSKGLDVFIRLAETLDPSRYQIVLVGTDDNVDRQLPANILSIHRTQDQAELAEIYSAADVFVNPTRQDNYPTVNMEAIACGTPVLTFRTGGSPEIVDGTCGSVVDCDDVEAMRSEIIRICEENPYPLQNCLQKAREFDKNIKFDAYMQLYREYAHD